MTLTQQITTIAIVVFATMLTRFLPFILFPADKPTPKYILYLGGVLPPAVFGMLVIYCLKDTNVFNFNDIVPKIISIAAVVILHCFKKNMLLSIAGGTVLYMVLVQFLFV